MATPAMEGWPCRPWRQRGPRRPRRRKIFHILELLWLILLINFLLGWVKKAVKIPHNSSCYFNLITFNFTSKMSRGFVTFCWAFKSSFLSLNLHSCCFTISRHLQDVAAALLSSLFFFGKKVGVMSAVAPGLLDMGSVKSFSEAIKMNRMVCVFTQNRKTPSH